MERNGYSISRLLCLFGCVVFDFAVIIAFSKAYAFFSLLSPVKSLLMLMVILMGLTVLNCAILFPDILLKKLGIPYSAAVICLLVAYSVIANIFSIFFIAGSTIWYIVWQLVILAILFLMLSAIAFFSQHAEADKNRHEIEQSSKNLINEQLLEIERAIMSKENNENISQIIKSFKALKERINASTPFGRITGNVAVLDIENTIKSNLVFLESKLQTALTDNSIAEIKQLLDDTRRLVINRETLNIK